MNYNMCNTCLENRNHHCPIPNGQSLFYEDFFERDKYPDVELCVSECPKYIEDKKFTESLGLQHGFKTEEEFDDAMAKLKRIYSTNLEKPSISLVIESIKRGNERR